MPVATGTATTEQHATRKPEPSAATSRRTIALVDELTTRDAEGRRVWPARTFGLIFEVEAAFACPYNALSQAQRRLFRTLLRRKDAARRAQAEARERRHSPIHRKEHHP
jgi:hypothetical protein